MAKKLPEQYMCKKCSYIQDEDFDVCPACGVDAFGQQTRKSEWMHTKADDWL